MNTGGESGIRTHVTLSSKHAFQACAFSHSAISPAKPGKDDSFPEGYRNALGSIRAPTGFSFILWTGAHERKSSTPAVASSTGDKQVRGDENQSRQSSRRVLVAGW